MDFSPRHGDTLQLSPSHLHTVASFHDELRSLRRGISRSPSKNPRVQRTSPSSPSRQSPLSQHFNLQGVPSPLSRTPRDANPPPTTRKIRPSYARPTPIKGNLFSARIEAASQPAQRRPLSLASGNSSSQSSQEHTEGQENRSTTPEGSPRDDNIFTVPRTKPQNSPFVMPSRRPKSIAVTERDFLRERAGAKSSPLKRSDGIMNLDQPSFGSPSAKRRSLHGAPFEIAKDVEMKTSWGYESDEDREVEATSLRSTPAPRFGAPRKPNGTSRVSDRANIARNPRSLELDPGTPQPRRASIKVFKPRASLEGGSSTNNEIVGTRSPAVNEQTNLFAKPARPLHPHPLSRTVTPASPVQPAMAIDQNINHCPPDTPDTRPAFSKSLPVGALRPHLRQNIGRPFADAPSNDASFATPKPFIDERPDPAAFRSTGLISKRHRDVDDMPPPPGGHNAMPDTPCKKMPLGLGEQASPTSVTSIAKRRFAQPLFGLPTKTFNSSSRTTPGSALSGLGEEQSTLNRSTSFISNDGSDCSKSPNGSRLQGDSQSSADELPPTPTKQIFGLSSMKANIRNSSLRSSLFGRRTSVGPSTFSPPEANEQVWQDQQSTRRLCKSTPSDPDVKMSGVDGSVFGSSQTTPTRASTLESPIPSCAPIRRGSRRSPVKRPSPLSRRSTRHSDAAPQDVKFAKTHSVPTVTQSLSIPPAAPPGPQTPADVGFPDPSQLSISPTCRGARTPSWRSSLRTTFTNQPETPSSHRHGQTTSSFPVGLTTPSHHAAVGHDIDPVLTERFDKVAWLGKGEFSDVFKVHRAEQRGAEAPFDSPSNTRSIDKSPSAKLPDAVYVVKKTKAPLHGSRVRERIVREAQIMQALGRSDHVVTLIDSWEARNHLYLMIEYCEEGSLDAFLSRAGRDGRLDDFRIWKVMLEVGAGLRHIHNSGFLHLDLKPENIFIDFSGALKIGDFGLACQWPASQSTEGEGDRRYIGQDLLMGKLDKPADVFAFGMMMYEIAGNVEPPDNGTYWHKLRSGDFSGLPSLTSASSNSLSAVNSGELSHYTSNAEPPFSPNTVYSSRPELPQLDTSDDTRMTSSELLLTPRPGKTDGYGNESPSTELMEPPAFMLDQHHPNSLDQVVRWMMLPTPQDRPTVDEVLDVGGCRWVAERRRAGAVIWEGKWGPSDAVLQQQLEQERVKEEQKMADIHQHQHASQGTFFDDDDAEMMDA